MSEQLQSMRDDRKRQTSLYIHTIAERFAIKHGLLGTKIDEIAERAGISRRTFFNYYATKEDAILGLQPPVLSPEALRAFAESKEDILTRTVHLILNVNRSTVVSGSSLKRRVQLRNQFPELRTRFDSYITMTESIVRPLMAKHIADDSENASEITFRLAGAIIRYAYSIDSEMDSPSVEQSIKNFKKIMKEIA